MKVISFLFLASALVISPLSNSAIAQDGSLDLSFNERGRVITQAGNNDNTGFAIALQSDGKIVIAGHAYNFENYDFLVNRYNVDGSLDSNFNNDGSLLLPIGTQDDMARAIDIQADGKIVVGGFFNDGIKDQFAVVRLNSNGSLDTSFNHTGKVTTSIGKGSDNLLALAIQGDGKIVAAGFTSTAGKKDFAAVRYNTNGSLDVSFDGDGMVTTSLCNGDDFANAMRIQSDGKIVLAGSSFESTNFDFALLRYNSNGSIDNSFGTNGKVTTAINDTFSEIANGMSLQNDGKIIVVGSSNSNLNDFIIVRYNDKGSLDNTFGNKGIALTEFDNSTKKGEATCVAIQSDQKIVAAGWRKRDGGFTTYDYAVARYHKDGILDMTFGNKGLVSTNFATDGALAVAIQSDEKIVITGSYHDGVSGYCSVLRYNNGKSGSVSQFSSLDKKYSLSPNPSTTFTNLNCSVQLLNATVDVYDAFGRLLISQEGVFGHNIILGADVYPAGIYFVVISEAQLVLLKERWVISKS